MNSYTCTILKPGGNDTALVYGLEYSEKQKKLINDQLLLRYPNLEQVGFVNLCQGNEELIMAGGEFCGNATRSAAWLALGGKQGELTIKVSGASNMLRAGVDSDGNAYSQMPIYNDPSTIVKTSEGFIVQMQGITHLVSFNGIEQSNLSPEQIKVKAFGLIKKMKLVVCPAAGVIWCEKINRQWKITPVVFVRDINTLFLESACGSGTTALGLVCSLLATSSSTNLRVIQPSGLSIFVNVNRTKTSFTYAQISGRVTTVNKNISFHIDSVLVK